MRTCGQPVDKGGGVAPMQPSADQQHRHLPAGEPAAPPCTKLKKQFHKEAADELCDDAD
jgi:hypothetical protein